MNDFRTSFSAYILGDLDLSGLKRAVDHVSEAERDEVLTLLENSYQQRRISLQLYSLTKQRLCGRVGLKPDGDDRPAANTSTWHPASGRHDVPESPWQFTKHPGQGKPRSSKVSSNLPVRDSSAATSAAANSAAEGLSLAGASGRLGPRKSDSLHEGSAVNGKYLLKRMLGRGRIGVVWLAQIAHPETKSGQRRHVALKVLNRDFCKDRQLLDTLKRGVKLAGDLNHPNIANVWSIERAGEDWFMTMEYLGGEVLERFMKRHHLQGIDKEKAFEIIDGLVAGLNYAFERGIIHLDLRPAKIFLARDGQVKILDYGLVEAKSQYADSSRKSVVFDIGSSESITPAYASCEMLEGMQPDVRSDVYGLACITYELLAGHHPFNRKSAVRARGEKLVPEPVEGLSRDQNRVLRRGLAFRPEDRMSTPARFLAELNSPATSPVKKIGGLLVAMLLIGMVFVGLPRQGGNLDQQGRPEASQAVDVTQTDNRQTDLLATGRESSQDILGGSVQAGAMGAEDRARIAAVAGKLSALMPSATTLSEFDQLGAGMLELQTLDPDNNELRLARQKLTALLEIELGLELDTRNVNGAKVTLMQYSSLLAVEDYQRLSQQVDMAMATVTSRDKALSDIDVFINSNELPADGGTEATRLLDALAAVGASLLDLEQSRAMLVDAYAAQARRKFAAGAWNTAEALANTGESLIVDAATVNDFAELRSNIAVARQATELKKQVIGLFERRVFTATWDSVLWDQFKRLQAISDADLQVSALAEMIAAAYLDESRRLRIDDRQISQAQKYLRRARDYDPSVPGLASEEAAIDSVIRAGRALDNEAPRSADARQR